MRKLIKYSTITILVLVLLAIGISTLFVYRAERDGPLIPRIDTVGREAAHIETLTTNGGRVGWRFREDLIVFDRENEKGYFEVWTMDIDTREERCLTCDHPDLPSHHKGQPEWHPSGEYIVFQTVDPDLATYPRVVQWLPIFQYMERQFTAPGAGINNNLWLMSADGEQVWQLTQVGAHQGVLHPHFSWDGKQLVWTERVQGDTEWGIGIWEAKAADFVFENGRPELRNVHTYQPGMQADHRQFGLFYETHGFYPGDENVLLSSSAGSEGNQTLDIYTFNLGTEKLTRLTHKPKQWDEHAQISPDGERIVWMSSRELEEEVVKHNFTALIDLWIMDSDGSNKQRLTYFNTPTAPEYLDMPDGVAVADSSWSPDGRRIVVYVVNRTVREDAIKLITLDPSTDIRW